MPRKTHKKRKSHRGAGLKEWAKKAHAFIRKKHGYSNGLSYAYNKFAKPLVKSKLGKHADYVDTGVKMALDKLRQSGYGMSRTGSGLMRSGSGLMRSGSGLKRSGSGLRRAGAGLRIKY
jgi:hypothetical protein